MTPHHASLTIVIVTGVIVTGLSLAQDAQADKLDDFKTAKTQKYCASIPYQSLRQDCQTAQADANHYCNETSCKDLNIRGHLLDVEKLEKTLATLTTETRDLESKLSGAKDDSEKRRYEGELSAKKRDFEQKTRELESLRKEIENRKVQIKERIAKGERCRHDRLEVQRIFQRAAKQTNDETIVEIKKIATEDLVPHWNEEGIKHSEAIINSQNGLDVCTERLQGR